MRPASVLPLLLVVVAGLVYANGLAAPFLFDDQDAIVENPHIRSLWPPAYALSAPPQSTVAGRPLVSLSLAVNHAVGGLDPRGFRAFNIGIHAICALLLLGVVRRTLECPPLRDRFGRAALPLAGCVALLWTVHPLGTETVTYITQRTESIMATFYLLTLYASIRAWGNGRGPWTAIAIVACALGMASKETMVTAPVAVVLHDLAYRTESWRETIRTRWPLYAGLAFGWLVLAGLMLSGPRAETVGFSLGIGATDYLKNQCIVVVDYLRHTIWPHPLVIDYGYVRPVPLDRVVLPAIALVVLAVTTAWTFLRRPAVGFPALWIFVVLAPTSSFIPIVSEVGAERRMYLPLAGVIVLAVLAGHRILFGGRGGTASSGRRVFAVSLVIVVAAGLAWVTHARNEEYLSEISIWQSGVAARPTNPRAHNNLGRSYHVQGDLDRAGHHYRRALELDDRYSEAHYNLGVALAEAGHSDEAIARYRRALQLNPALPRAHHNLGSELAGRGDLDEALPHFRNAASLAPDLAHVRHSLARALRLSGYADEAVEHYREAIRLGPDWTTPRGDLAWLLATHPDARLRAPAEARRLAQEAVDLAGGDDPVLLDTLAAAHASNGDFDLAVLAAERAVELARRAGYEGLAAEIEARLDGYRGGEPYREP